MEMMHFLSKYYETNSSYHLRKLGMMFRVELKNKLLGFVRRASRHIQSTQTRCTLYLSIVLYHLGYATQVWSPQLIG